MSGRVLVVDDDVTVAEVLRSYLTQAGFDVDRQLTAHRPRGRARTRPDLVVLDLMLPGCPGWRSVSGCARAGRTWPWSC